MYETYLHKTNKEFLAFARSHVKDSQRAVDMVGWKGGINFCRLDPDLALLYQLTKADDGWSVTDMHMLLFGAEKTLRTDVCRVSKFWKVDGGLLWNPDGNILWHASLVYGGRCELPFVVANAWMKDAFDRYAEGGNYEMTFAGLGAWMECRNDRGLIRFHGGTPVELARRERKDPTIDHEDMDMSQLRSLNPGDDKEAPALAEFTGVIDACESVRVGGERGYRIRLWSGPADSTSSFPWNLLIAACRIDGRYVPRVGDFVHGSAVLFGTFHGEAQTEPTVFEDRERMDEQGERTDDSSDADETKPAEDVGETGNTAGTCNDGQDDEPEKQGQSDWEYLPRKPAAYPDVVDRGKGLVPDVAEHLPNFVTYAAYRKAMKGNVKPVRPPSRKDLRQMLGSIDYAITSEKNRHMFADVFEAIGIRHFVEDSVTGERHLWCCLPSGFGHEHFLTNLLVAMAPSGEVLRYTFHMGEWDRQRLSRGSSLLVNFQSAKNQVFYEKMVEMVAAIDKMGKDEYLIATELGHTVMVQAWCEDVKKGRQTFTVEWQIHYLPWQFSAQKVSATELKKILETFDAEGIESVETMLDWHWCKMKCNT